ncbi:MAG: hypothetical protein EBU90_25080 [Proteobacteria bacterium]|nr:hypothetical protein [Pseudomonadota bacterium]
MSIFDFIADILFKKQKNTYTNIDNESVFSPYMVNRWISMYSNALALKSNLLNKYLVLEKKLLFSLFINVYDKVSQRKITYFKKNKENIDDPANLSILCNSLEVSKRELKEYMHVLNYTKGSIK